MTRPTYLFSPPMSPPLSGAGVANEAAVRHITNLWTDDALVDDLMSRIDYFMLNDPAIGTATESGSVNYDADWLAMMLRLKAALDRHPHVKLIYDLGGPLGYNPSVGPLLGYGADSGLTGRSTPAVQGQYSAEYQLDLQLQPILDLGFSVYALELQSSYGRLIEYGDYYLPHQFYRGFGTGASAITYTAVPVGTLGQDIRVRHVIAGNNTALSVAVASEDITVNLATDGAGAATSTVNQVVTAVNADGSASLLVEASPTSSGTGVATDTSGYGAFFYGDDGVNYTPTQTGEAFVAWMDVMSDAVPGVRFLLNDSYGILGPWDGVAGYASRAYPDTQPPEGPGAYDDFYAAIRAGGQQLWGYVQDWSFEFSDGLIDSINETAEASWYKRTFAVADYWLGKGLVVFHHNNSLFGSWVLIDGSFSYLNTESLVEADMDRKYQQRVLSGVAAQRAYLLANPSYTGAMDGTFSHYSWRKYPAVVLDNEASPSGSIPALSFTDGFFRTRAVAQPRRITVNPRRHRRFG